jgi:hypothetical protein
MTWSRTDFSLAWKPPLTLTNQGCTLGERMECPTVKTPLWWPFCCYLVYPHYSYYSRDCSLDPSQPGEASLSQVGVHPCPSLTVQDHPPECLCPSSAGPFRISGYFRAAWGQPCFSHSGSWLIYTWQKTEESPASPKGGSFPCFPPVKLDEFSVQWSLNLRLWFMCTHYLGRKSCHQDFSFSYLLLLCKQYYWVIHPQSYHLCGVLPW